ncbi:hypothetical protein CYMTET_52441 [Cymbomonas tetramitiformis]|uniref:RRM domain-containing protein n=1 Tax=Cymbomonas tetramitiformis TaxID=36881 RepID=A0AAE0ER32_9CHLO|nr:hypothetical protein CYMTET_52441 [Cymbomonas tetramitiformis]
MEGEEVEWYYLDAAGVHQGPVSRAQIRVMFAEKHLGVDTLFWANGLSGWAALKDVAALQDVLQNVRPAATPEEELQAWKAEMEREGAFEDDVEESKKRPAPDEAERPSSPEDKRFVDDDGTTYVWDSGRRCFVPKEAVEIHEYDESEMVFTAEAEIQPTLTKTGKVIDPRKPDAEKVKEAMELEKQKIQKKKEAVEENKKKQQGWFDLKNNSSVYVTGLPPDTTVEEVSEVFSKCGIIKDDVHGQPRVKLYRDKQTNELKGDGLVTYLRIPSVELACTILDGSPLRPDLSQTMTVSEAKFEQKGDYVQKKSDKNNKKQKIAKQEKTLGWGGFDDLVDKKKLTVILRNMFTQEEVENSGLGFVAELEEDIAGELSKLGPLTRLKVHAHHPEGAVTAMFKTLEAATACVEQFHGRWFGGQQLYAEFWDGTTNFHVAPRESAEEEAARLERFSQQIES